MPSAAPEGQEAEEADAAPGRPAPSAARAAPIPRLTVVGLGPAGPEFLTAGARAALASATAAFVRTARHPAARGLDDRSRASTATTTASATFDEVYRHIVEDLVAAASAPGGRVVYAVPGSPAGRRADRRAPPRRPAGPGDHGAGAVVPRPGLGPARRRPGLERGAPDRRHALRRAGRRASPVRMLVAQCWSTQVLSDIKLSVDTDVGGSPPPVTVLHHLGLPDERVQSVRWEDLDRVGRPDHLTSIYIPELAAPVAAELVALDELVRTLRARCPWDQRADPRLAAPRTCWRRPTRSSRPSRRSVRSRRPLLASATPGARPPGPRPRRWPTSKRSSGTCCSRSTSTPPWPPRRAASPWTTWPGGSTTSWSPATPTSSAGRRRLTPARWWPAGSARRWPRRDASRVTDGIPTALPALALASKLQRRAGGVSGLELPSFEAERDWVSAALARLGTSDPGSPDGGTAHQVGALLFGLSDLGRQLGVDPEEALRAAAMRFRAHVRQAELGPSGPP